MIALHPPPPALDRGHLLRRLGHHLPDDALHPRRAVRRQRHAASPTAVRAKLMAQLGLDQPLWVQYFNYMWGVLHFDFGVPYQSPGETVIEPARPCLAAEPRPRRARRAHRRAARHPARHGGGAPPQQLDRLSRLDPRDARAHHPGLRHLDAADPGLRRLAQLAAGQRLGQARALDPADHRLCRRSRSRPMPATPARPCSTRSTGRSSRCCAPRG